MSNCHRLRESALVLFALASLALPGLATALTVSPGAIHQGESGVLMIYTPGTQWSPGVSVDAGVGITSTSVRVQESELLRVDVTVDANAETGPRSILVQQGQVYVIGTDVLTVLDAAGGRNAPGSASLLDVNVITNPGFETGDMTGWIPVTWSISTVLPHSGVYDAYDPGGSGGGGQCLRQEFNPAIDSNTITSFSLWLRQPDDFGIAQVAVWYQNGPTEYGVIFTNDDDSWTSGSFPGLLRPNDFVTAIHICGFGGGTPEPDDSWSDDFELMAAEPTPVEQASWGRIKGIYR